MKQQVVMVYVRCEDDGTVVNERVPYEVVADDWNSAALYISGVLMAGTDACMPL